MNDTPAFSVKYRDGSIDFFKVDRGFGYRCPAGCCRAFHWIDTESGTRHRITSAVGEPVTIVASLGCPCTSHGPKCSFHVVITDGVARDV
jgi:hypothetical protein